MQTTCTAPTCAMPAYGRLEVPEIGSARLLTGDLCEPHLWPAAKAQAKTLTFFAVRRVGGR